MSAELLPEEPPRPRGGERSDDPVSAEEERRQLRLALEWMPVGFCMLDGDDRLQLWNRRFAELWKLPAHLQRAGATYEELVVASGAREITHPCAITRPPGTPGSRRRTWQTPEGRVLEVFVDLHADGTCVALHEDVTERHEAEQRVAWLARHDILTGLANRELLRETLAGGHGRARTPDGRTATGRDIAAGTGAGASASPASDGVAVLYLDLDRFKNVNDSFGHAIGDVLLREVARRLVGCCRDTALIARLGGDEFAVVDDRALGPGEAERLGARIVKTLSEPFELDGRRVQIGASVGIAIAPHDGNDADTLLQNADLAMYHAKAVRRGTVSRFVSGMDVRARERSSLESDLRSALERGELAIAYQPQVELAGGTVCGVEALLRWNHPRLGPIAPSRFVPIAEETGSILPIGRWVLREACRVAAGWTRPLRVAVNVSAVQFQDGSLLDDIAAALDDGGLPPSRLEIEITESVVMENEQNARTTLLELQRRGIGLAMDDFGTGHSSLSHLRRLPFDRLKIDRSFVRDLDEGPDALTVIRAVAALGTGLGMSVTVEGVETPEQLEIVRREGCSEVQGYLFGRPCEHTGLAAVLDRIEAAGGTRDGRRRAR